MQGNPIKQTLLVIIAWGLLSIPIYIITTKKKITSKNIVPNTEAIADNNKNFQTWVTIKSLPNLKELKIIQNNNSILSRNEVKDNFFEEKISFFVDEGFIEFEINAIFKEKSKCFIEITLSDINTNDITKNIWGDDGNISDIVEFKVK